MSDLERPTIAAWGAKYDKGGAKFDADKLRYDLIPVDALAEIAKVFTVGAKKYADRNWQKGIAYSRLLAAMDRHKEAYKKGEQVDAETGCHHLASVAWYCLVMMEFDKYLPEMDDRAKMRQYGEPKPVDPNKELLEWNVDYTHRLPGMPPDWLIKPQNA